MTVTQAQHIVYMPRPFRLLRYVGARLRPLDIELDTIHKVLKPYGLEPIKPPQNLATGRRNRNVAVETAAGKKLLKCYRPQWGDGTVTYAHSVFTRLAQLD